MRLCRLLSSNRIFGETRGKNPRFNLKTRIGIFIRTMLTRLSRCTHAVNAERETPITIRQVKYLNNVVEQDQRAIKRITRPMQGFKDFRCARIILSGIEVMHMIRKRQMKTEDGTRGWNPSVRRRAILFDGCVSSPCHFGSAHQDGLIATEPL